MLSSGQYDYVEIKEGRHDRHLRSFKLKEDGCTSAEWKGLHPMQKRKRFLVRKQGEGGRSVQQIEIADMDVIKKAMDMDKVKTASLKRKLKRANKEDPFASDEDDASHITGTTAQSNKSNTTTGKMAVRQKTRSALNRIYSKKKAHFADNDDEN